MLGSSWNGCLVASDPEDPDPQLSASASRACHNRPHRRYQEPPKAASPQSTTTTRRRTNCCPPCLPKLQTPDHTVTSSSTTSLASTASSAWRVSKRAVQPARACCQLHP